MTINTPPSFSIYRGYTDDGIGNGKGHPVSYGEQYLQGTAETLSDYDFLNPLAPWLTLDAKSTEHKALKEQLEAWSCFSHKNYLIVARLVSAGDYDGRAAYFSHARAWQMDNKTRRHFDPAVYLGCSRIFDKSKESRGVSDLEIASYSPEHIIQNWVKELLSNDKTLAIACKLLAHLYQALTQSYPLLIAAPISEFTPGSRLFALIALARCALPPYLKQHCDIRLFTRNPGMFKETRPQLIMLPEDCASQVLQELPNAALLGVDGNPKADRRGNWQLERHYLEYAEQIIDLLQSEPKGLLPFGEFLQRTEVDEFVRRQQNNDWVYPSYVLASTLADHLPAEDTFKNYISNPEEAHFPWAQLLPSLSAEEWTKFPLAQLSNFALQPPENFTTEGERKLQQALIVVWRTLRLNFDVGLDNWQQATDFQNPQKLRQVLALWRQQLLTDEAVNNKVGATLYELVLQTIDDEKPALRQLQKEVEEILVEFKVSLDDNLGNWWSTPSEAKQKRLLQLLNNLNLFADREQLASKTSAIPLDDWIVASKNDSPPLTALLQLELDHNKLDKRSHEISALEKLTPEHWEILLQASLKGQLDPTWLESPLPPDLLEKITRYCLQSYQSQNFNTNQAEITPYKNSFVKLYSQLKIKPISPALSNEIKVTAQALKSSGLWDIYFRLANLLPEINGDNELIQCLLSDPGLKLDLEKERVEFAFNKNYRCLSPASLVTNNGDLDLSKTPLKNIAAKLLALDEILQKLNINTLLKLFNLVVASIDKEIRSRVYKRITNFFLENDDATTKTLISLDTWYYWRREYPSDWEHRKQAALAWLRCRIWTEENVPEATLEAWKQVITDCGKKLDRRNIETLRDQNGKPLWPIIPWFEREQLQDLHSLAADLGVSSEIMLAVKAYDDPKLIEYNKEILSNNDTLNQIDCLIDPNKYRSLELDLTSLTSFKNKAGHLIEKAVQTIIFILTDSLDSDEQTVEKSLSIAEQLDILQEQEFVTQLKIWIRNNVNKEKLNVLEIIYKKFKTTNTNGKHQKLFLDISDEIRKDTQFFQKNVVLSPKVSTQQKEINPEETLKKYYAYSADKNEKNLIDMSLLHNLLYRENISIFLKENNDKYQSGKFYNKLLMLSEHIIGLLPEFYESQGLQANKSYLLKTKLVDNVLRAIEKDPSLGIIYTNKHQSRIPVYELYAASELVHSNIHPGMTVINFINSIAYKRNEYDDKNKDWLKLREDDLWWLALKASLEVICCYTKSNLDDATEYINFNLELIDSSIVEKVKKNLPMPKIAIY